MDAECVCYLVILVILCLTVLVFRGVVLRNIFFLIIGLIIPLDERPVTCDVFFLVQLKEHKSLYEGYVPMKYKHYYKKMKKYVFL
jgi:hypothetical protein